MRDSIWNRGRYSRTPPSLEQRKNFLSLFFSFFLVYLKRRQEEERERERECGEETLRSRKGEVALLATFNHTLRAIPTHKSRSFIDCRFSLSHVEQEELGRGRGPREIELEVGNIVIRSTVKQKDLDIVAAENVFP